MNELFGQLKTINQANGFSCNVTDVKEGTGIDGVRLRGIAVETFQGGYLLHINAESKALAWLQTAIEQVLTDYDVSHTDAGTVVAPKRVRQRRSRAKEKPTTTDQEIDDATS